MTSNANPESPYYDKLLPADMIYDLELPGEAWHIDQLLAAGGKMLIAGAPKTGKSLLATQLTHAAANGRPFLKYVIPRPLQVVYLQYEVTLRFMQTRLHKQAKKLGRDYKIMPFFNNRPSTDTEAVEHIYRAHEILKAQGKNLDLVVIDPMVQAHQLDENSSKEMRQFTSSLDRVIEEIGCSIVMVHHTRKGGDGGQESARGSTQIIAWPNSNLMLRLKDQKKKDGPRVLGFDLRDAEFQPDLLLELDRPSLTFEATEALPDDFVVVAGVIAELPHADAATRAKVIAERLGKSLSTAKRRLQEYADNAVVTMEPDDD